MTEQHAARRAEEVAEEIDAKFWALPLGTDQEDASAYLIDWIAAAIAQATQDQSDRIRELEHEIHHMETVWLPEKVAQATQARPVDPEMVSEIRQQLVVRGMPLSNLLGVTLLRAYDALAQATQAEREAWREATTCDDPEEAKALFTAFLSEQVRQRRLRRAPTPATGGLDEQ